MYKQRLKRWGVTKYSSRNQFPPNRPGYRNQSGLELRAKFIEDGPTARARPDDVQDLSLVSAGRAASAPKLYIRVSSPFAYEEGTYHAIKDYYHASFSSFFAKTLDPPPTDAPQTEAAVTQVRAERTDLFSRFNIALMKLNAQPPDPESLAEGMKIMRVCFARLPALLAGEDPELITSLMDLFRRLQMRGNVFIEEQLRRHILWLAKTPGQPRSTTLLSRLLSHENPFGKDRRSVLTQIAIDAGSRELGPWHFKTLQFKMWHIINCESDMWVLGLMYQQLYHQLEAGTGRDVFDKRHLDMLVNVANHHLRNFDPNDTVKVVNSVLEDPARLAILKDYPDQAYDIYWLAGKAMGKLGKHVEAEPYFREAFRLTAENSEADVAYLSGVMALELNLRDQNRLDEADELSALRQAHIRQSLESVGEKESET